MTNKMDIIFVCKYAEFPKATTDLMLDMADTLHANYEDYIHKPTVESFQHTGIEMLHHYQKPLQFALKFTTFLTDEVEISKEELVEKIRECKGKLQASYSRLVNVQIIECDDEVIYLN